MKIRTNAHKAISSAAIAAMAAFIALTTPRISAQTGSLVSSSWTHGVSVQIEDPSQIASLSRRGFAAQLRTYSQTWVHFAIPTPVIQSGTRLRLQRVMLLWSTDQVTYSLPPQAFAYVRALHVWDGDKKLAEFGGFNTIGHCTTTIGCGYEVINPFNIPGAPYVNYGIVVSLLIDAPVGVNLKSVGGDFYTYSNLPQSY